MSETWHDYYCDSLADLTLLSNDGVLFKASSHHLAKASAVFADMKSTANHSSSEPIDIDASASVLGVFLDMAHVREPFTPATPACDTLTLARLCIQFDCNKIRLAIYRRLSDLIANDPWDVFAAASYADDPTMAKNALYSINALDENLWVNLGKAKREYSQEFMRVLAVGKVNSNGLYMCYRIIDPQSPSCWKMGVDKFKPESSEGD